MDIMSYNPTDTLKKLHLDVTVGKTHFRVIDCGHGIFFQSFPRHVHSYYEFHYICNGNGTLVTDTGSFPLEKGNAYMIPPRMYHEQITDKNNFMEEFHIAFEIQKSAKEDAFSSVIEKNGFWLGKDTYNMAEVYHKIETELTERCSGYTYALQALFAELLISYIRNTFSLQKKELPHITKDEKRTLLVDEAFLYSYATITLPALADLLNLSINHTHRFIVKQYGMSFAPLRTIARLNAAAGFLSNTDDPISLISDKVGFSNPIYFTQKFKEQFGIAPSTYRKQHRTD